MRRLHPVRQVRAGLPACGDPGQGARPARLAGAPALSRRSTRDKATISGLKYTVQVAPEDCTGCELCVKVARRRTRAETRRKAINMVPQLPLRDSGARELGVFPETPGSRPHAGSSSHDVKNTNPATAVRIFRRVRGLRRNAVPQAAHAAVRRSAVDRQCHRLLLHLRRQSAHHAVDTEREGRGPAWSNSLFEDNAEFGLGFRLSLDKQAEYAGELVQRMRRIVGGTGRGILHADQSRRRGIYAAAPASAS